MERAGKVGEGWYDQELARGGGGMVRAAKVGEGW